MSCYIIHLALFDPLSPRPAYISFILKLKLIQTFINYNVKLFIEVAPWRQPPTSSFSDVANEDDELLVVQDCESGIFCRRGYRPEIDMVVWPLFLASQN